MQNNLDNSSYLILYLGIILVIIYVITFLSSYTCNFTPKENFSKYKNNYLLDNFTNENIYNNQYYQNGIPTYPYEDFDNVKEHFANPLSSPPLTINDYTLVGVGTDNTLYCQDVINMNLSTNFTPIPNSGYVIDICASPSGTFYGIGTNNTVWIKPNLNTGWTQITSIPANFINITMMTDGKTLLLTGTDYKLYTWDSTSTNTTPQMVKDGMCCPAKVIQLQNGSLLAFGNTQTILYGATSLGSTWTQLSSQPIGMVSIAQLPNGSFIALGQDQKVYTKTVDTGSWNWNTWTATSACCLLAFCVLPMPSQNINGYERRGAFIDDSSRTIPNLLGNFPTITECINMAQSKGYNTVGYQDGNYCFAGTDSPYDRNGFQTNSALNMTMYPGGWTNIVYKTDLPLVSSTDPVEGEVFVFPECQFSGTGSKLTIGQYPSLETPVEIKSLKIGLNTKVTFFTQANFSGISSVYLGNSDVVNKDSACIDLTFSSVQVEKYPNALPSKPANLTTEQLGTIWTESGCKAESMGFNAENIANWKRKNTVQDVITNMKQWATSSDPKTKQGCYTLTPQPNVPDEGELVLFENCEFTGKYKKYGTGSIAYVGKDFDKLTSSIKIGPYTSVSFYSEPNFLGKTTNWKNDSDAIFTVSCLTSVNFDNMTSSIKVMPSSAQVDYTINENATPVTVLGPWNSAPWNLKSFPDTKAQWIWQNNWNGQFPSGSAPINSSPIRFQLIVPVKGNRDVPVIVHVIADNAPQGANFVRLNGNLIGQIIDNGWTTSSYSKIQTVLAPGNNLMEFDVQNIGGGAGLLVTVLNSNTLQPIASSGGLGQWAWIDPSKIVNSVVSEESGSKIVIHDEAEKGKVIKISNPNEMPHMLTGGIFRLSVDLKNVPPYIKGSQYKEGDINKFYLSVEKLDPNCEIEENNRCMKVYVDNKKCNNKLLSSISRTNAHRLVLVSKAYVLDPKIPFGKNVDFTIVKVGEKLYLKNVQTGYMPKLFVNDYKQDLYGYMDVNYLSNINSIKLNNNKLCNAPPEPQPKPKQPEPEKPKGVGNIFNKAMDGLFGSNEKPQAQAQAQHHKTNQKFVNCQTNADGSMYMLTTTNLAESNPVKFVSNPNGSVSIRLQHFNSYGNVDKTFSLIYCNFNVNTYAFIEKLTNPIGTFLINMVCFDPDDKRQLPSNTLDFSVEVSKFSDSYLKEKNIYNLNV